MIKQGDTAAIVTRFKLGDRLTSFWLIEESVRASMRAPRNLRIALTGRGGSGKTSLAHALSKSLTLPFIHEVIRNVAAELNITRLDLLDPADRLVLQTTVVNQQSVLESLGNLTGFVSDRSLMDSKIYTHVLLDSVPDAFLNLTPLPVYDLVVYVPPFSTEPEDDGFRFNGTMNTVEDRADALMRRIAAYPLKSKSLDGRVDEILHYIVTRDSRSFDSWS